MKTLSSEYIKKARASLGLTQDELARWLSIKRYNLAKYETGQTMPPGDIVIKIIRYENVKKRLKFPR